MFHRLPRGRYILTLASSICRCIIKVFICVIFGIHLCRIGYSLVSYWVFIGVIFAFEMTRISALGAALTAVLSLSPCFVNVTFSALTACFNCSVFTPWSDSTRTLFRSRNLGTVTALSFASVTFDNIYELIFLIGIPANLPQGKICQTNITVFESWHLQNVPISKSLEL